MDQGREELNNVFPSLFKNLMKALDGAFSRDSWPSISPNVQPLFLFNI